MDPDAHARPSDPELPALLVIDMVKDNFCVLTTATDAICHDFKAVLLSDCTASYSEVAHEQTLALYRKNPLFPLLRVLSSDAFIAGVCGD